MPSSTTKATRRHGVVAAHLPTAHGKRVVFVSSNSDAASGVIAQLARDLGFAPIELGRIDEGGRLIQARNALVLRPLIELSTHQTGMGLTGRRGAIGRAAS
jgi:predicted dinucleotide-binding enzyme